MYVDASLYKSWSPISSLTSCCTSCIISVGLMYITKHYRHRNWPQNSFNLFILYLHVKLYRLWKCKLDFCISAAVCRAVRVMWRSYIITFRIILHLYVTDLSPLQSERKELWTNIWIKSATIICFYTFKCFTSCCDRRAFKSRFILLFCFNINHIKEIV